MSVPRASGQAAPETPPTQVSPRCTPMAFPWWQQSKSCRAKQWWAVSLENVSRERESFPRRSGLLNTAAQKVSHCIPLETHLVVCVGPRGLYPKLVAVTTDVSAAAVERA